MLVARLDKRVNLRIDSETYEAYEKISDFFDRSIADFMREALTSGLPTIHALGAMIDQAKAGDAEAVQRLMDGMLRMHQGYLDVAKERALAEGHLPPKEGGQA